MAIVVRAIQGDCSGQLSFFTIFEVYGSFQDYNFGTLLRLDPKEGYTSENTCFALRVQFLAIEIARNKEGANNTIYRNSKPKAGGCCSKC